MGYYNKKPMYISKVAYYRKQSGMSSQLDMLLYNTELMNRLESEGIIRWIRVSYNNEIHVGSYPYMLGKVALIAAETDKPITPRTAKRILDVLNTKRAEIGLPEITLDDLAMNIVPGKVRERKVTNKPESETVRTKKTPVRYARRQRPLYMPGDMKIVPDI